ncbi:MULTISPECIES: tetratricopeptide repeat protein [unclassified Paludibacterium]|uniref:tetratricopeptide repeat protein n=1 Tax=unclassified Paludibacterium TaxID=2618429 RepID=UPI001C05A052|nr:tetratricopeptide repeat protein [Paludibacterium sp. B53371]BEV71478.1 tetratricopeptide repeat protein [Paludibacterium sp. THUN1379]
MPQLDALLKMVDGPRDNALLRFAIGGECLKLGQLGEAETHLRQALVWQPDYTAAWKLLGKVLVAAGQPAAAVDAYQQGIAVAVAHGDVQAQKEMTVFLRRLQREAS